MSARKALPGPEGGNDLQEALARRLAGSGARPEPDGGRPHIREERAAPPPVPELDAAQERRWRREVGVTGLALKAARADVAAREADWARLIADARQAGVPERILVAAAADADEDLPERL